MNKSKLKVLGNLVSLACILFLVYSVINLGINGEIIEFITRSTGEFVLLIIIWVGVIYLNAFNWGKILSVLLEENIKTFDSCDVYVQANIAKYLPGNVFHFAGRNILSRHYGWKQSQVALSTMTEIILLTISAAFIGVITLGGKIPQIIKEANIDFGTVMVIACGFVLLVVVVGLVFRNRLNNYINGLRDLLNRSGFGELLGIVGRCFLGLLVSAGTFVIILNRMTGQNVLSGAVEIIGIYVFSWFLGFITPGSPGGIGVRETVLLVALNTLVSSNYVLIAGVVHRLITIVGDVLAYALLHGYKRLNREGKNV